MLGGYNYGRWTVFFQTFTDFKDAGTLHSDREFFIKCKIIPNVQNQKGIFSLCMSKGRSCTSFNFDSEGDISRATYCHRNSNLQLPYTFSEEATFK